MVRVAAWTDYVLWCLLLYVVDGRQLRILGLQPMSGFIWTGGPACVAPIQMAIDDVHAHPGLLDGYNLTFDLVDSQVMQLFKIFLKVILVSYLSIKLNFLHAFAKPFPS